MSAWFSSHMDLVFLLYGMSFLVLGFTVAVIPVCDKTLPFAPHMRWLALFGLIHGTQELLDGEKIYHSAAWLDVWSNALLLASYLALLEFARRGLRNLGGRCRLATKPMYVLAVGGFGLSIALAESFWIGFNAGARFFIGMPAALITGCILFKHSFGTTAGQSYHLPLWLRIAAGAFVSYAALTPLLPAVDPGLPAWLPTNAEFFAAAGLPVQVLRALCAITAALAFSVLVHHAALFNSHYLERSLSEMATEREMHERLLQETVALSEDAIFLYDFVLEQFVDCNQAALAMLGASSKDQLLFVRPWDMSPEFQPDGRRSAEKAAEIQVIADQQKFYRFEWMHRRLDGRPLPVEVTLTPVHADGKELLHVVWRDLTENKRNEAALKRYYRALTMLSAGNQTLVRSDDEEQLLASMCRVAVKTGGYRMAWVGYCMEDEAKTVAPMAYAGLEQGYLSNVKFSWGDNEYGHGPTGLAIRSGRPQSMKDMPDHPEYVSWHEQALKRGYQACVALPLLVEGEGKALGAFMLYSADPNDFDEAEMRILEEMTEDLAYGIVTLRNNQKRLQMERDLEKSYSLLQASMESTADGILVTAANGEIESFNHRFSDMFDIEPVQLEHGQACKVAGFIGALVTEHDAYMEKLRVIRQNPGETFRDVLSLSDGRTVERISQPQYLNGQVIGRICSFRDISEQIAHERQLTYLATHDALTGLANRTLLFDRLEQRIAHAQRSQSQVAVLFLDVDRFKLINDSLGHDSGDLFLHEIARRLPACIRAGDTLARMGGDEFVVMLPDLPLEEDAVKVAHKLLAAFVEPFRLGEHDLYTTASIGISLFPRDGRNAQSLLKHADAAMYRAKESGGNCFQFVTQEINEQVARRLDIANRLRDAMARDELSMYYQPQFGVADGSLTGAEALIRWQHPERGMVSPAEFIPIAEESGLILDLGLWVLESVYRHLRSWSDTGLPKTKVAVNLSARQLDLAELPDILSGLQHKYRISADCVELEITEGMVMKNPERAVHVLGKLKAMGFSIAIDDFGTGYSSLAYLKRFPIDKLKVDRSFVMDIPGDADDAAITGAVIAMAHQLRLKVVAEGVETEQQLAFLRQCGCDVMQGYLSGRPMPEAAFAQLLAERG